MIIVTAILYLSSARYSILSFNQLFTIEILPYWFVAKNLGNYRKYIFFNFRFMENMIYPLIAENQENMIFALSFFTKMLFFMQCLLSVAIYNSFLSVIGAYIWSSISLKKNLSNSSLKQESLSKSCMSVSIFGYGPMEKTRSGASFSLSFLFVSLIEGDS